MSGAKSKPRELRAQRRPGRHSCWDHLIVAPLWVAYDANLGTLLRTCDAVGACLAVPCTSHYQGALRFIVQLPDGATQPLPKRWAMLRLVEGLAGAGLAMGQVSAILPASKTLRVSGVYIDPDELWAAIQAQFGKSDENRKRWHLADPIVEGTETWVLHNNWGDKTRDLFKQLLAVAPPGFAVYEEGEVPESLA